MQKLSVHDVHQARAAIRPALLRSPVVGASTRLIRMDAFDTQAFVHIPCHGH